MSNAKFKFYGLDESSNSHLMATESHPKVDATDEQLGDALTAVAGLYRYDADKVVLSSDTTVFVAD